VVPYVARRALMAMYIGLCNFTDQGIRTIKDVPDRAQKTEQMARELGCTLTPYPTLGPYDVVFMLEAPDDKTASAFFLRVGAAGNFGPRRSRFSPAKTSLRWRARSSKAVAPPRC
jgi:uncharacterized protein with GYD domain